MPAAARRFGPGDPASGRPVECSFEDDALLLFTEEGPVQRIDAAGLKLRPVGFNEQGLAISWVDEAGGQEIHVLDAAVVRGLLAELPMSLGGQLRSISRTTARRSRKRFWGWVAVGLFVLAPLLSVILALSFDDELAAVVVSRIPPELERDLGEDGLASLGASVTVGQAGPVWETVESIGDRLTAGSSYDYRFFVAEDDSVNAFALPGGIVVVNRGLVSATASAEELAGVIAHEVQHVELRHGLTLLVKQLGLLAVWSVVSGDLGSTLGGLATLELLSLGFSREAETQADLAGMETLRDAGINPEGMVTFFERLAADAESESPAWLSTHPTDSERGRLLRDRLQSADGDYALLMATQSWPPELD